MKKRLSQILVLVSIVVFAVGCMKKKEKPAPPPRDVIYVYDKEGKEILETDRKEDLDKVVNLVTKYLEKKEPYGKYEKLPKDGEVAYHYQGNTKKGMKLDMFLYSNYPIARFENLPVVSKINVELTQEDHKKLLSPEFFFEGE